MYSARDPDDIDRFFRGLAEHAFHARLGVVDPPLVDYVSLLLVRFIRNDSLRTLPGAGPAEIDEVAGMFAAVSAAPSEAAREEYRHIGDYTLFWSGLYPESLKRFRRPSRRDHLLDYRAAGKQAYWIASTLEPDNAEDERQLLERLSHEYDLCVAGLTEVRRTWGEPS
jgi:hypothetical protein